MSAATAALPQRRGGARGRGRGPQLPLAGLTALLCSVLIIDITVRPVAMATVRETFNLLSSIIIIYEAICCGK